MGADSTGPDPRAQEAQDRSAAPRPCPLPNHASAVQLFWGTLISPFGMGQREGIFREKNSLSHMNTNVQYTLT